MVCGGIVELSLDDGGRERFLLPKAFADLLTRRAGNANMGVYTQEIPLLTTCSWQTLVERFKTGEGINYDHYPRFQTFMSQLANAKHRQVLVNQFLPAIDGGNLVEKLNRGLVVCDIGCAEGIAVLLMAEAFPESEFTGMDIDARVIANAQDEARDRNLQNARFLQVDAATIAADDNLADRFDYVTAFDAIHDQTRPEQALKGVYHMLKPGGIFSMVDIAASSRLADNLDHPMGAFLYTVSLMHCLPVGRVDNGMGLGMMWGREKARHMLGEAGFSAVEVREIPDDPFNDHFYCRKPVR
jgi:ubiquinone/menaquinone biosynthesis C-methylase UbiE